MYVGGKRGRESIAIGIFQIEKLSRNRLPTPSRVREASLYEMVHFAPHR